MAFTLDSANPMMPRNHLHSQYDKPYWFQVSIIIKYVLHQRIQILLEGVSINHGVSSFLRSTDPPQGREKEGYKGEWG